MGKPYLRPRKARMPMCGRFITVDDAMSTVVTGNLFQARGDQGKFAQDMRRIQLKL